MQKNLIFLILIIFIMPNLFYPQKSRTIEKEKITNINVNTNINVFNNNLDNTEKTNVTNIESNKIDENPQKNISLEEIIQNTNTSSQNSIKDNFYKNIVLKEEEDVIIVQKKEKGWKIFIETGGGTLVSGGFIYRINPIFGIGMSTGYTYPPFINYGMSISIKTEMIPLNSDNFFKINFLKMNLLVGINGIFFLRINDYGSGTQFMGAITGIEFIFRNLKTGIKIGTRDLFYYLQDIVPNANIYLYLVGESIVPQLSFQVRYSF